MDTQDHEYEDTWREPAQSEVDGGPLTEAVDEAAEAADRVNRAREELRRSQHDEFADAFKALDEEEKKDA